MDNWKEYLFDKFPDRDFSVDRIDNKNDFVESYSIKTKGLN